MFTLAQPAYYPTYNPYEELLLQQELQRRRQVEAYLRRQREAEELECRRQYECAIRQAELERRRQAEYERRRAEVERRRQEVELQRRRDIERHRHSMFDAGVQDLFDMIYGGDARPRSMSMSARATPTPEQSEGSQRSAVSSEEKPSTPTQPTPTSAPAPGPSISATEADQEPEDETPQIDTAPSLAAVESILASFATLQSEFAFPTHLDFLPSSSESSPRLAYTPNNAPLHGYEHALTGLLTQLDAVESFGNDEVRRSRKEAVKTVEKELEKLDVRKAEAWKKQFEPEVSASRELESVEAEADVATEVDPHAVPLPHDSDVEDEDEDMGEAAPEVSPSSERVDTRTSPTPIESPLLTSETLSTPAQSPLVEDLPPLPDSPVTVASTIAAELPTLTPIVIPSTSDAEPLSSSVGSPSPSESSDTGSDMELEEYVDVALVSASEGEGDNEDAEQEVEKEEDLELVRDWDLDF